MLDITLFAIQSILPAEYAHQIRVYRLPLQGKLPLSNSLLRLEMEHSKIPKHRLFQQECTEMLEFEIGSINCPATANVSYLQNKNANQTPFRTPDIPYRRSCNRPGSTRWYR